MVKQNWKCRECGTFTLSEARNYLHKVKEDYIPTNSRIKVCTNLNCGRIYDENGYDKLINDKKVYLKAGKIIVEGETIAIAMI